MITKSVEKSPKKRYCICFRRKRKRTKTLIIDDKTLEEVRRKLILWGETGLS